MGGEVAGAMWRFLNAWPEKPVAIGLDVLGKGAPGMALVRLSGTVVEKRFVDGGFIGRWPFAVRVRVAGGDTDGRLAADRWLDGLWAWMRDGVLALDLGAGRRAMGLEMTGLVAQAAAYPDGTEDYQGIYALRWRCAGDQNPAGF